MGVRLERVSLLWISRPGDGLEDARMLRDHSWVGKGREGRAWDCCLVCGLICRSGVLGEGEGEGEGGWR